MWEQILSALWFFAPAGLANIAPILAAHLPILEKWDAPVDGGKKYRGQPIFGKNKTVRGLVFGILAAYGFLLWQRYAVENGMWASELQWIDYSTLNLPLAALAFGLGALGGDMIESFFKRQFGIKAGETWFPFDQIDYVLGAMLAVSYLVDISVANTLTTFAVWFVLHPIATVIGWMIGLKDKPI